MCKRLDGRGTSDIVGGAASCSVVVHTSKSGVGIVGPTIQRTEGRPDRCEHE